MTISFCRRVAVIFGILLPVCETIRRWGTVGAFWRSLDDYIIGAFLIYSARRSARNVGDGQRYLAAAFGFGCGIGYASFFGHLGNIDQPDVGPIPHVALTIIIGLVWALGIWSLVICLQKLPEVGAASPQNHIGRDIA